MSCTDWSFLAFPAVALSISLGFAAIIAAAALLARAEKKQ
jgi:hypothetical protein